MHLIQAAKHRGSENHFNPAVLGSNPIPDRIQFFALLVWKEILKFEVEKEEITLGDRMLGLDSNSEPRRRVENLTSESEGRWQQIRHKIAKLQTVLCQSVSFKLHV